MGAYTGQGKAAKQQHETGRLLKPRAMSWSNPREIIKATHDFGEHTEILCLLIKYEQHVIRTSVTINCYI